MDEKSKRINSLDIAKGIAILYVLFRHINVGSTLVTNFMILLIGNYDISAFFLASGYVFKPGRGAITNLKKRIPKLIKIYFIYSIAISVIYVVIGLFTSNPCTPTNYFMQMRDFYLGESFMNIFLPNTYQGGIICILLAPFWFLVQMILASFLYFPIAEKTLEDSGKCLGSIAGLFLLSALLSQFAGALPFNLQATPAFAGYMLIGAFCGKKKLLSLENGPFESRRILQPLTILTAISAIICAAFLGYLFPGGVDISSGFAVADHSIAGIGVFILLLISLCGMFFLLWISTLLGRAKLIETVLVWFGRNTMEIFLVHMLIGLYMIVLFNATGTLSGENVDHAFLRTSMAYLLTILLCVIWTNFINFIKSKIAFYKKKGMDK